MKTFNILLGAVVALALASPGFAESSASTSSTASSAGSASIGSVSDSFQRSSDSSSRNRDVAEGDYKLIEVADVAERPGFVSLKLQAVAGTVPDAEFVLFMPRKAFEANALVIGQVVTARQRPYGMEFAKDRSAFFLVLEDAWYRELQSNVVSI